MRGSNMEAAWMDGGGRGSLNEHPRELRREGVSRDGVPRMYVCRPRNGAGGRPHRDVHRSVGLSAHRKARSHLSGRCCRDGCR